MPMERSRRESRAEPSDEVDVDPFDTTHGGSTPRPEPPDRNIIDELRRNRLSAALFGSAEDLRIGRFVVDRTLGRGGMGQVFRAYDPQLDREVALKRLRRVTDDARARLLREAQAMAQLSHPNVLPVYDVSADGHRLFIAMELVRGQSLREWLAQGGRSWQEVLVVFVAAGLGLHAAHEAGLVHRDFKPANVLIGDDGRVRVMDFGLARGMAAHRSRDQPLGTNLGRSTRRSSDSDLQIALSAALRPSRVSSDDGVVARTHRSSDTHDLLSSLNDELTQMGTVIGTPSYMAPEQHLGSSADVRSDQYSFCVALWEALYGQRPFSAKTIDDWYRAKTSRRPRPAIDRGVPRWLHAIVLRGLSAQPGHRYRSMLELLRALNRGQRRRRRGFVALGVVLVVGGLGAASLYTTEPAGPQCNTAADKLVGVWDSARARSIEQDMLATDSPFAADTWARLAPRLDDYADRWTRARTETCEATHVRHEQPEALMDARIRCLDGRLRSFRALVDTLADADATVVERAVSATTELPSIEQCDDEDYVQALDPPPDDPALAADVLAVEEQLARVRALARAGKAPQALPEAEQMLERARALGYAPLSVRALLMVAELHAESGHYEQAQSFMEEAYFASRDGSLEETRARAAIQLIHLLGTRRGQVEDAHRWERFARAALQRVPDPNVEAAYLNNVGLLAGVDSDYPTAIAKLEQALEIHERIEGPEHPRVARVLNNLGLMHDRLGHYDEALALHRRALDIRERVLGPHHPHVATSLLNISNIHKVSARYDQALEMLLRAHDIWTRAYGIEHPYTAGTLVNLGSMHEKLGEYEQALDDFERAIGVLRKTQGEFHPNVGGTLVNKGNVHRAQGDDEQAKEHYRQAKEVFERTLGPDDALVALPLVNLASVALDEGDLDTAEAHAQRALEISTKALGDEHPKLASIYVNLAMVHERRGQLDEALPLHERAVALRREGFGPRHPETGLALAGLGRCRLKRDEPELALGPLAEAVEILAEHEELAAQWQDVRFAQAQAWWDAGQGRDEARRLARKARAALVKMGAEQRSRVEEIDRWLREHGGGRAG